MAGGSDVWVPQVLTPAEAHQGCPSHQGRDLTLASEADVGDARRWALDLRHFFGRLTSSDSARSRPAKRRPRVNLLRLRGIGGYWITSLA